MDRTYKVDVTCGNRVLRTRTFSTLDAAQEFADNEADYAERCGVNRTASIYEADLDWRFLGAESNFVSEDSGAVDSVAVVW